MDKFWAWWALVFYILPVIIFLPLIRSRRRAVNSQLTEVALKYGGTVKSMIGIPYFVGFDLDGQPVSLSLAQAGRSSPAQTSLAADITFAQSALMWVGPPQSGAGDGRQIVLQEIETLRPDFDEGFVVQGNDDDLARAFLEGRIQDILLKWRPVNATFQLKDKRIRFTVYELIREEERLDEFISDSREIFGRLRELLREDRSGE